MLSSEGLHVFQPGEIIMTMNQFLRALILFSTLGFNIAANSSTNTRTTYLDSNFIDSENYDPRAENIEEILNQYDEVYEKLTGESAWLEDGAKEQFNTPFDGCYRFSCAVFIHVKKSKQTAYLYIRGRFYDSWLVSTGVRGRSTPNFDRHPNGRVYTKYSSRKFPGGDYKGLGNMPYAVFIRGGFALHGTPRGNWRKLGRPASHGCIRMHPDNGRTFNRFVRSVGVSNTWITVN